MIHSVLCCFVVGEVLHDVLYAAVQDGAQLVDGEDLDVFVVAQAVQLGAVDAVVGVQVVLGNAALAHGFPKTVVFDHKITSLFFA